MASPAISTQFGTTIAFGTTTALNALQVADINWSGSSRDEIDATHYASGSEGAGEIGNADKLLGDVNDAGAFDVVVHFNPDLVPVVGSMETVTITWKSGATWVFQGGIQSVGGAMPMRDKGTLNLRILISGPITVTAAP